MRFVVVGLGSMGRRRIRLLKQISDSYEIIGVDSNSERCIQAEKELAIKTASDLDIVLDTYKPDGVIVSTSPLSHGTIINKSLKAEANVFKEINLIDDMYDENIMLAKDKNKVLFLSSTFLYRSEIDYIYQKVSTNKDNLNYNYHVGQYLPDWHPWESINNYFVGEKKTNGCRELFAIELPWIIKVFGDIESYEVLSSKNTGLSVQYNDNYLLLIKHKNGNKGILAVDVVSRKAVRNLEIYGENLYLTWDGTPSGLNVYNYEKKVDENINLYRDNVDKQEGYAAFVIENAYKNELETFIDMINGQDGTRHTFEEDYKILSMIDEIESR